MVKAFTAVQKSAATIISGAFRTTAVVALKVELHLLPTKYLLTLPTP